MHVLVFLFLTLMISCQHSPIASLKKHLGVNDLTVFKRKPKQERWDLKDNPTWNKTQILEDFRQLGLVDAVWPQKKTYETAVIFGATGPRMQTRIDYLIETWNQGVRFRRIVFLTGDRDLGPVDSPSNPGHSKNETELLRMLWERTSKPKALNQLPTLWIDAPKIKNSEGSLTRPTTLSTLETWAKKESLEQQDILAFSNQPLVKYQQCVTQLETVGPAAENDTEITVYLDALVGCEPTKLRNKAHLK